MKTVKERLLEFIASCNVTVAEFERNIGVSNGYVKNISKSIQPDILERISIVFPTLNIEWLLIERGSMLRAGSQSLNFNLREVRNELGLTKHQLAMYLAVKDDYYAKIENGEVQLNDHYWSILLDLIVKHRMNSDIISDKENESTESDYNTKLLSPLNIPEPKPHIDNAYASCGVPNGFSIAIQKSDCELVSIPFLSDYDFSIRAKGDSMINRDNPNRSIRDKDIIVCKLWGSRSHVRWGEVYALATTEGFIVKKILPSDRENCVKCVSFNVEDNYLPYDLPLDEIFDWATVVGIVSINKW